MESPIQQYLEELLNEVSGNLMGTPYSIHPAGGAPDPQDFGICLATVDGHVYSVGASDKSFSIQSISKPFSYGLALADHGIDAVDEKVDVEPSGDPFNEISLAPGTGRPANAMINAGALAVVSMIKGSGGKSAPRRIMDLYSKCAGRRLSGSKAVFDVEMRNSDRNHSLAYLLSSFGIIDDNPTRALENYLRQCSAQVTCRDLAMMAATLANGGTNPSTGETALEIEQVERVLSVMMTSGMYDDAGSWVSSVGMPAKSGVGGGTLAVLPGQAGLAVFSPPLDEHGSSVRGSETCRRFSTDMEMHFVRAATGGNSTVRPGVGITQLPSRIRRTEEQAEILEHFNERCQIIEVTGDLAFAGTESLVRAVSDLDDEVTLVVLDMQQVNECSSLAVRMLETLEHRLTADNRQLVLIERQGLLDNTQLSAGPGVPTFLSRGGAVEYCENRLLAALGTDIGEPNRVQAPDSPALAPLDEEQRARLLSYMEPRTHDDGDIIRRVGQRFGGVHFIVSGQVNTIAADPQGGRVRLNTLSAGMTFGELALGSDDRQETTEKAVGAVELMVLTPEAIEELEADDPQLALLLWRALTRDAYLLVDRYLRETAVRLNY
ncbi:glutaminase A [Brevibacterium sp. UCMA 11754]|uniref:glutaminase A n=1 Tax=Brevibacterium sp. UCMA 11754 TaxID=2749198 RepID=UPI001F388133|nr:glutaminase A [Brevibacterium sp. UCMA 11754]MCF2570747.1 glutaminase A [Brevibacterium sp. UCMA 11754]